MLMKSSTPYNPAVPLLRLCPRDFMHINARKQEWKVHSSMIYNSQKLSTSQMLINIRMTVEYTEILNSKENE